MNQKKTKEIWLAGGCFWGTEHYLKQLPGVVSTDVGYANGHTKNPTYEEVCTQSTGHAEAVHVVYDPTVISLSFLLRMYFESIDPTSHNRQGGDTGPQYRTGIYYSDPTDLPLIQQEICELLQRINEGAGKPASIAIQVEPLENYAQAEEYHQAYLDKNPNGYCHIPTALFQKAKAAREYIRPDDETLRARLTPIQYEVTRQNATEAPATGEYTTLFAPGLYVDVTTGEPLFWSQDKFDSGCGWPAFSKPVDPNALVRKMDFSHGMERVEVRSQVGDAHLGHVFNDGPAETGGQRYCINSAALRFIPADQLEQEGYGYLLESKA